ncbi:MAG: hypothetical protein ACREQ4_13305 [Candidatus Binataceae bacterium]
MTGSTVTANVVNADGSNGAAIGNAPTAADGGFTLTIPAQSGPVRLTASGGTYTSEMNGATIPASPVSILIASPNGGVSGISINPLSTFVDTRTVALIATGSTFNAALGSATSEIEALYGLTTDPGTLVPQYTATDVGTDAGNLGLILGAIINEDQYLCPSAPGGLVTALAQDISDGVFDGMSGTPPAAVKYCNGNLPAIAGTSDFQDALSGVPQLELVTQAFAFGGTGNALTASGLANIATGGTPPATYPTAPLTTIDQAVTAAAPTPVATDTAGPVMNTARYDGAWTNLPNGDFLIAGGGGNSGSTYLGSIERYISATGKFATGLPAMSVGRANETATLLPNGLVLIAGGATNGTTWTNTTDLYNPAPTPGTVTPGPAMTFAREGATAVLLPTGQVLIAGGRDQTTTLNQADLYTPPTSANPIGTITAVASPMAVARYDCAAALLPNGNVLIAGGFGGINQHGPLQSTEIYDTATSTFTPGPPMTDPLGRAAARATLLPNGKVLVAGGVDGTAVVATAELYDPTIAPVGSFTPVPGALSSARKFQAQILLPNGNVLIAGGYQNNGTPTVPSVTLNTTDIYNSASNTLAPGPVMSNARGLAAIGLLPDGNAIIAGGFGSADGGFHRTTDLFTP